MARFRKALYRVPVILLTVLAILLLAEVASIAAKKQGWTPHDLAFYLDPNQAAFIRPGLNVRILSVTVQNNVFVIRFRVTDPAGMPLDRDGVFTPGPVSTSFTAAYIPKGEKLYAAYNTRMVASPITNKSALQASTDSGGRYAKVADGEYTYTFGTALPANYDPSLTHSIGLWSRRNLSEFGLPTYGDDDIYTFVPDGSTVAMVRDVVRTETCNKCHDPLSLHGGQRFSVQGCILCHQPQSIDPDTGNTVDMTTMIHKIHMGPNLPSVKAGTPYQIIGYGQAVHNYSAVTFPDTVNRCETCHTGGAQSNIYMTTPSRRACGSCHDDVNFATGENHVNLPQVSDNLCANCHIPQGELEFDASIKGAHTNPSFSAQLAVPNFTLEKVENFSAGQKPRVTFNIKDRSGAVIEASSMNSVNLLLSGPTTDYSYYVSESARAATRSGDSFVFEMANAVPEGAKGTYTIAIEGYRNATLNRGTTREMTVRDVGYNRMINFSVDGSTLAPRRQIVDEAKCNSCHGTLMLHGTFRRNVQYCVICHNPNTTDVSRRTRPELLPAESVHFKTMIHKIHSGEELATNFTIFGFGSNAINFNEVTFPGDRRNCSKCHVGNSYQLPLPEGVLESKAPRDWINPTMQPATAACLSCHTQKSAAAHALLNTSSLLGEACDVCHGPNAEFSINRVHAR